MGGEYVKMDGLPGELSLVFDAVDGCSRHYANRDGKREGSDSQARLGKEFAPVEHGKNSRPPRMPTTLFDFTPDVGS